MKIIVKTRQREYPIVIERGALGRAAELIRGEVSDAKDTSDTPPCSGILKPGCRAFLISDSGVPQCWKDMLQQQFPDAPLFVFEQGEANKNIRTYESILSWLAENRASRRDVIIALGGGVVGDMAGFAAATYMRGIAYVNIPTTSLSQIDSSIGGKTAIDFAGLKNIVGAFWQPSMVIVDTDTLSTLPARQLSSGLAEAVKSGLIGDRQLFEIFETAETAKPFDKSSAKPAGHSDPGSVANNGGTGATAKPAGHNDPGSITKTGEPGDVSETDATDTTGPTYTISGEGGFADRLDEIIYRSLMVKKSIVEQDENESSLRKLLNLGHSFGHAYESWYAGRYLHGECVAMGMMTIIKNEEIRGRLRNVLLSLGLPTEPGGSADHTTSPGGGNVDNRTISGSSTFAGAGPATPAADDIISLMMSDKKAAGSSIDIAQVDEIGSAHIETWTMDDIRRMLK